MSRLPPPGRRAARAIFFLCAACCLPAAAVQGETIEDLSGLLARHGIGFNVETANVVAAREWLRAVDPFHRIVSADELRAIAAGDAPAMEIAADAPEGVGRARLRSLSGSNEAAVVRSLRELAATKGMRGLILDIRGAGGDGLGAVDAIAGMFEGAEPLLYRVENGRGDTVGEHRRADAPRLGKPLMLLVDHGTHGAAELLAAVLNDCRGVMLVGTPTQGDNYLREPIPLPDGRFLYIASRRLVPGSGSSYAPGGVVPDVVVPPRLDAATAPAGSKGDADPVLARATDILMGLKALGADVAAPAKRSKD